MSAKAAFSINAKFENLIWENEKSSEFKNSILSSQEDTDIDYDAKRHAVTRV